jgi:hypothetical protein
MNSVSRLPAIDHGGLIIGLLIALLFGCTAYLAVSGWQMLFPRPQYEAHMTEDCDLNVNACTAAFDDASQISLALSPRPPTPREPISFTVEFQGHAVSSARVILQGVDMNMGVLTVPLSGSGDGRLAAETSLPVCTRRQMTWAANVVTEGADGTYHAHFKFATQQR